MVARSRSQIRVDISEGHSRDRAQSQQVRPMLEPKWSLFDLLFRCSTILKGVEGPGPRKSRSMDRGFHCPRSLKSAAEDVNDIHNTGDLLEGN